MSELSPEQPIITGTDPLIGQEIGGAYRLVRIIGTGGMGTVYEARHLRLNRRCAVKVLLHTLQEDPTYLERFRREAEVTSRLKNRHICEVLDFNHLPDGSPYLAMEYLEGEDLATRIRRRPLSAKEMAPILEGVGSALAAAHKIGVLHRDIKPANIFLARTPENTELPKLLDFGAAKRQGQDSNLTATGQVLGSVWYVSPEQARGQELDHRTDIFSLGIVLYEALTGRNPFEAPTPTDTLFKIVTDSPPPLRTFAPGTPPELDAVLARALAKKRDERYATVVEFVDAAVPALDAAYRRKGPRGPGSESEPILLAKPLVRGDEVGTAAADARPTSPNGTPSGVSLKMLLDHSMLSPSQYALVLEWEKAEGELIFDRIVATGFVDERALLRFIAGTSGYKYITGETLAKSRLPTAAVARVPAQLAEQRCVAPLAFNPVDGQLTVAIPEPSPSLLEEIRARTGVASIQGILALRGTIRAAIRRFYPAESLSAASLAPAPLARPPSQQSAAAQPLIIPGTATSSTAPTLGTAPPEREKEHDTLPPQPLRAAELREPDTDETNGAPDSSIVEPLLAAGLVNAAMLEQARTLHRERGGFLGDALLRLGALKEVDFLRTFAELYGTQFVKSGQVVKVTFDEKLLEALPVRVAEELRVLPFSRRQGTNEVHVIAAVPLNPEIEPRVKQLMGARAVTVYLATPGVVQAALRRWYYGDKAALGEVTPNGAGPGPMRPRTDSGAEPERDASQKTVQVAVEDTQTAVAAPTPTVERLSVELQKRLTLELDPLQILDAVMEVVPVPSAALVLVNGKRAARGLRSQVGESVPRARVELAMGNRQPIQSDDAAADPLLGATRLVREKGVKAALTVPLLGRKKVHGVLHLDHTEPIADAKPLIALAELIALRLDDVEALEQIRAEARSNLLQERFLPHPAAGATLTLPVEGQLVQATLLIAQLRELDDLGGRISAPELVTDLNRTWAALSDAITRRGGALVELQGNRLLALWSPALATEQDAVQAIEAALAMQMAAATLSIGGRPVGLRVGVHAGLVTVGKVGTAERADFTVVGSALKLAARLTTMALEGQVLASETAITRAGPVHGVKPIPLQTIQDLGPATTAFLIGAPAAQEMELGKG